MNDLVIAKRAKKHKKNRHNRKPGPALGLRWPVERTNAWFSNYGQLRRNTDLKVAHR